MTEESYEVASEVLEVANNSNDDGNIFSSSTVARLKALDAEFDTVTSSSDEDERASLAIGQIAVGAQAGSQEMVDTGIDMLESTLGR